MNRRGPERNQCLSRGKKQKKKTRRRFKIKCSFLLPSCPAPEHHCVCLYGTIFLRAISGRTNTQQWVKSSGTSRAPRSHYLPAEGQGSTRYTVPHRERNKPQSRSTVITEERDLRVFMCVCGCVCVCMCFAQFAV